MNDCEELSEMITPKEIGERIERGQEFVKRSLREGTFPVGKAIFNEEACQWSYIIPRAEFENWISGKQPTVGAKEVMDKLSKLIDMLMGCATAC